LIWVAIDERNEEHTALKRRVIQYVIMYAVGLKAYLRTGAKQSNEFLKGELQRFALVEAEDEVQLSEAETLPLDIIAYIDRYLVLMHDQGCMTANQLATFQRLTTAMIDDLGVSERILRTPLPENYVIHLRMLLVLYCILLPLKLVDEFGWHTVFLSSLISFTMQGIEELGVQSETPFGCRANDLDLSGMVTRMRLNVQALLKLPSKREFNEGKATAISGRFRDSKLEAVVKRTSNRSDLKPISDDGIEVVVSDPHDTVILPADLLAEDDVVATAKIGESLSGLGESLAAQRGGRARGATKRGARGGAGRKLKLGPGRGKQATSQTASQTHGQEPSASAR
jgi:predicted membrane chloride channel (bestrophin family)